MSSISSRRRRASARLRHCDRVGSGHGDDTSEARAPRRVSNLLRSSSLSAVLAIAFHDSSTRVAALLACCPPGPPEVSKCQFSSSAGMANHSPTRIGLVAIT
jgi:hypothetical protein